MVRVQEGSRRGQLKSLKSLIVAGPGQIIQQKTPSSRTYNHHVHHFYKAHITSHDMPYHTKRARTSTCNKNSEVMIHDMSLLCSHRELPNFYRQGPYATYLPSSVCCRYGAEYLGMLESPAEGIGCWTTSDTTVVTLVGNATFPAFAKLCEGGYGSKTLEPNHTIIVVNPEWTKSKDIGQPWDR